MESELIMRALVVCYLVYKVSKCGSKFKSEKAVSVHMQVTSVTSLIPVS